MVCERRGVDSEGGEYVCGLICSARGGLEGLRFEISESQFISRSVSRTMRVRCSIYLLCQFGFVVGCRGRSCLGGN